MPTKLYLFVLTYILNVILLLCTSSVQSYLVHPAVLANDADEALLPATYRRSRLVTPDASVALALGSWFGDGEKEVHHRETEQIDRSEIYSVLRHAGFLSH